MFKLINTLIGLLVVYLSCALIAWDIDPGNWGWLLRLWGMGWAVVWGLGGLITGHVVDEDRILTAGHRARIKKLQTERANQQIIDQ